MATSRTDSIRHTGLPLLNVDAVEVPSKSDDRIHALDDALLALEQSPPLLICMQK